MKKYFLAVIAAAILILAFTIYRTGFLFFSPPAQPAASINNNLTPPSVAPQGNTFFPRQSADAQTIESSDSPDTEQADGFITRWTEDIRQSERAEDLLLAGLLSKNDPADKERFLLRALELTPDNLLLNYAIADYCGHNSHASLCAMISPEPLLKLDPDNGFMWSTLANQAYSNGDINGARHYLEQAVGLYQYNSQTPQLLRLIDESLIHHGAQRDFNIVTATNGIQAAQVLLSHHDRLISMCREQPDWQDICREIGQTMMSQGREAMDVITGRQLLGELSPDAEFPPLPGEWETFYKSAESPEQQRLINVLAAENPPVSDETWQEYLRLYEAEGAPAALYYLTETLLDAG